MKDVIYPSPNIKCDGCAETIKGALANLNGVDSVEVDVPSKRVTVHYDENVVTPAVIEQHMAQVGFPSPGPQPVA